MICPCCQGETKPRRVRKHHWDRGRLYVIHNVPAEVCPDCGERYLHAKTLGAIDKLLDGDYPVTQTLQVEVVSMGFDGNGDRLT